MCDVFNNDDWVPHLPSACTTVTDCEVGTPCCAEGKCNCTAFGCKYENHTQWTQEVGYGVMLDYKQYLEDASQGRPNWCPPTYAGAGNRKREREK